MMDDDDFDPRLENRLEYLCRKVREMQEMRDGKQESPYSRFGEKEAQSAVLPLAALVRELEKAILQVETLDAAAMRVQQLRSIAELLNSAASRMEALAGYFPDSPEWH